MDSKTNGAEDEDSLFLERVLDKLYDFGSAPKQKLKSKKKKRKRCDEEEEEEELFAVKEDRRDSEDCRGGDTRLQEPHSRNTGSGSTGENQVQVVSFQDPRKKLKTKPTPAAGKSPKVPQIVEKQQNDQQEELNLEKARLEVHRFGITGYRKEQQRVFEQDRAIMLGARPPKKDYVNYKLLQEQIKEKKQKAKEEVQPELKKKKKQRNDRKKSATSGSGAALSGQVGRFKDGMLILSSKEIQKIKGRKGGRR